MGKQDVTYVTMWRTGWRLSCDTHRNSLISLVSLLTPASSVFSQHDPGHSRSCRPWRTLSETADVSISKHTARRHTCKHVININRSINTLSLIKKRVKSVNVMHSLLYTKLLTSIIYKLKLHYIWKNWKKFNFIAEQKMVVKISVWWNPVSPVGPAAVISHKEPTSILTSVREATPFMH